MHGNIDHLAVLRLGQVGSTRPIIERANRRAAPYLIIQLPAFLTAADQREESPRYQRKIRAILRLGLSFARSIWAGSRSVKKFNRLVPDFIQAAFKYLFF